MSKTQQPVASGVPCGVLSAAERQLLIEKQTEKITGLQIASKTWFYFFFLLAPLLIGLAMQASIRKERELLTHMRTGKLEVFRRSGVLNKKYQGPNDKYGSEASSYLLTLDGAMLSGWVYGDDIKAIKPYLGQQMTVEYIPEIYKNRCCYDGQNKGYNFITKSPYLRDHS